MTTLHLCVVLAIAYLLLSWYDERRRRINAHQRIARLEAGLRTAVDREQAASRRAARLDSELRVAQRRHSLPMLGLPHHTPGKTYRN